MTWQGPTSCARCSSTETRTRSTFLGHTIRTARLPCFLAPARANRRVPPLFAAKLSKLGALHYPRPDASSPGSEHAMHAREQSYRTQWPSRVIAWDKSCLPAVLGACHPKSLPAAVGECDLARRPRLPDLVTEASGTTRFVQRDRPILGQPFSH